MTTVENCIQIINTSIMCGTHMENVIKSIEDILLEGKFVKILIKAIFGQQRRRCFDLLVENYIEFNEVDISSIYRVNRFASELIELLNCECILEVKLIVYEKLEIES